MLVTLPLVLLQHIYDYLDTRSAVRNIILNKYIEQHIFIKNLSYVPTILTKEILEQRKFNILRNLRC